MKFISTLRVQWDRAVAIGALVLGLLSLLLGWVGVSGTSYVAAQTPYIVAHGLLGICLVAVAAVMWLSADMRDEWRELNGIRMLLAKHVATDTAPRYGEAPAPSVQVGP